MYVLSICYSTPEAITCLDFKWSKSKFNKFFVLNLIGRNHGILLHIISPYSGPVYKIYSAWHENIYITHNVTHDL